jgi:hypothetical protein
MWHKVAEHTGGSVDSGLVGVCVDCVGKTIHSTIFLLVIVCRLHVH